MNSKLEMKIVRDWLRHQVNLLNSDPYLKDVAARLSVRIVKWEERKHEVLICVRDINSPETSFNSRGCIWLWEHTWVSGGDFKRWRNDVWVAINEVIHSIRYSKKFNYNEKSSCITQQDML